jgi:twitching motility protein PilI
MAKREALRELQVRLAKRLQAAQSEGMSVDWLAVKAGGHNYLLPLGQSGEIVGLSPVQPVPYTKAWFKGVLNIRGSLFGVVDLAAFVAACGGPAVVPALAGVQSTQASVVTLNSTLEVNCALQVDSLAGLRGSDAFVSRTPASLDAPDYFGNCLVDAEGLHWQEIHLRALARSAAFLSIGT